MSLIWLRYFPQLATVGPAVKNTTLPSTPNKEAAVTPAEVAEAAATSVSPPVVHPTYQCALRVHLASLLSTASYGRTGGEEYNAPHHSQQGGGGYAGHNSTHLASVSIPPGS